MSPRLKFIGCYGNGAIAALFGFISLFSIGRYAFPMVVFEAAVCAMAIFNIRIILWAADATSEEEWLKSEVRKAELRQRLSATDTGPIQRNGTTPPSVPRQS